MTTIKIKYPKNQTPVETYCNQDHIPIYVITKDKFGEYILNQIDSTGKLTKIKTGQTPIKLNDYATEQIMKGMK